jgi:hypothetical protein
MQILSKSSENEMVSLFLFEEINSERWKNKITEIMENNNIDKNIVLNPNLNDNNENKQRKSILKYFRGYNNKKIFENFPKKIDWKWAILNIDEILRIKYIKYDYWEELSNGTRFAKDSVNNINNNIEIFGVKNDNFIKLSEYIKGGNSFDPLIILTSCENNEKMIVLEGHARLTAINLAIEYITEIKVLIGFVEERKLNKWCKY